jgi:imidazolonepropionase-like amidohydrolase
MSERIVLTPDRLIDTERGEVRTGLAVIIEGERILDVVAAADAPADARRIDLAGHTLLPGLMDMHSHLIGDDDDGRGYAQLVMRSSAQEAIVGVRNARLTVEAGFTTVRDIGTFRAFADVALREGIEARSTSTRWCHASSGSA